MNYYERKKQILDYLHSHNGSANMDKLSKSIFISRSTLRRDLILLENEGIIDRYHGSISLREDSASEDSANKRRMANKDKKIIISRLAKRFLHDNMVLFLDSSSTVSQLASQINQHKNITIITNGVNIASFLNNNEDIKCYLCPGLLKPQSLSIIGSHASNFLSNFYADIVFLSSKALTSNGIFEGDDSQALCKQMMLKNAGKKILLCDNSKEFSTGYFKLADYSDIDIIISNAPFSEELNKIIENSGCEVIHP